MAFLVLALGAVLIILWMLRVVDYPFFITGIVLSVLGLYWFGKSFVDGVKRRRSPPIFTQKFMLKPVSHPDIPERMPRLTNRNPPRAFRIVKQGQPPADWWSGPKTLVVNARPASPDTFIDRDEEMPGPWHVQTLPQ